MFESASSTFPISQLTPQSFQLVRYFYLRIGLSNLFATDRVFSYCNSTVQICANDKSRFIRPLERHKTLLSYTSSFLQECRKFLYLILEGEDRRFACIKTINKLRFQRKEFTSWEISITCTLCFAKYIYHFEYKFKKSLESSHQFVNIKFMSENYQKVQKKMRR